MPRTNFGMKVQFFLDTTQLEQWLGKGEAMVGFDKNKVYSTALFDAAFAGAELEFNREAAAYAAAGGGIKHMYEWGTAGINRGKSDIRPNPLSSRARLWGTKLKGTGMSRSYGYSFQPSVAIVPKPTAAETGMSQDVISELKDHVFWNKAQVFELGETVSISPDHESTGTQGPFLIMPFYKGHVPPNARANDIKRGYTLSKGPNVFEPGAGVQGNFTSFWTTFWENEGDEFVNTSVLEFIEDDFNMDEIKFLGGKFYPAARNPIATRIRKYRQQAQEIATTKALARAERMKARANQ